MDGDKTQTILFVDDEQSILDVASEFFEIKGYRVFTARNGLEAIEILKQQPVDCCFTDINMPEMDGLELAEHIWKKDNTIPVIMMTGYPSLENTIRTLKNGVVDFLIKPVNLNHMQLCAQRVMRERQLFIDNVLLKKEIESKKRLERLNCELVRKVEELKILNKIMGEFSVIGSSPDVFRRVVEMALEITPAGEARFFVINDVVKRPVEVACAPCDGPARNREPDDLCQPAVVSGGNGGNGAAVDFSLEKFLLDAVANKAPLLIPENSGTNGLPKAFRSAMVVPLMIRDRVFGIILASIGQGDIRFSEKDLYYLSFLTQNAANAIENLALYENIYENLFGTLYAFVSTLEARDPYTQQHSKRVTDLALIIGNAIGLSSEDIDILNVAGRLHDIGKIGIRDDILLKAGRLTDDEFDKIKEHPAIGASIVGQLGLWGREQQIIRCHHEWYDGSGYPDGIKKNSIPLLARILSVADAYDAMASDRAYRRRMDPGRVLKVIGDGAGTQFDPEVVDVFREVYHTAEFSEFVQTHLN